MSTIDEFLVENILEKDNSIKIKFRNSIIFNHKDIYDALTRSQTEFRYLHNIKLERVTLTTGGFDLEDGFQSTLLGLGNPNLGQRRNINGSEYPPDLKDDEIISELNFSFVEKEKTTRARKFRIRFVDNFAEIQSRPSQSVTNEIISLLKQALTSNSRIFLSSAKEKLRSSKIDFLGGRYRAAMHNVYYAMYNASVSILLNSKSELKLQHDNFGKVLEETLSELLIRDKRFRNINVQEYASTVEEAREVRELADYGVTFEIGGNEKRLSRFISKAEELVTIGQYLFEKSAMFEKGKLILHWPREQEEISVPSDLLEQLRIQENSIVMTLIVSIENFDATAFKYRLLSEDSVYYTDIPHHFFRGGTFARVRNGSLTFANEPESGYIELSKKNIKKWSKIAKPFELSSLATCKDNTIQHICFFFIDHFFELYVYPDGRLFLFSPLDQSNLVSQFQTFQKAKELIKRILSKYSKDYSVLSSPIEILLANQH